MSINKIENDPLRCKHCGYSWTPRKLSPKQCPKCKSYDYK